MERNLFLSVLLDFTAISVTRGSGNGPGRSENNHGLRCTCLLELHCLDGKQGARLGLGDSACRNGRPLLLLSPVRRIAPFPPSIAKLLVKQR